MNDDVQTERFDEGDVDSLDAMAIDANDRRLDAEATAKAFGAIETLSEVLSNVRDGRADITNVPVFLEHLRRVAQIATDFYTARGL